MVHRTTSRHLQDSRASIMSPSVSPRQIVHYGSGRCITPSVERERIVSLHDGREAPSSDVTVDPDPSGFFGRLQGDGVMLFPLMRPDNFSTVNCYHVSVHTSLCRFLSIQRGVLSRDMSPILQLTAHLPSPPGYRKTSSTRSHCI